MSVSPSINFTPLQSKALKQRKEGKELKVSVEMISRVSTYSADRKNAVIDLLFGVINQARMLSIQQFQLLKCEDLLFYITLNAQQGTFDWL